MQLESSEYVRKTTVFYTNSWRIKIVLVSYFDEHAHDVWERNLMNPEMHTTLLNTYPPKLIATILKALREQLKENDQLHSKFTWFMEGALTQEHSQFPEKSWV